MPEDVWSRPKDVLIFFVNGKKVIEEHADPDISLLVYLRTKLALTGTKLGCGEGGCGACTVMVSKWDLKAQAVRHLAVNACLAPVVSVHECAVTTVEGIGSTRAKLHSVQERLAEFHGSQCGFCTPGIVMSMYTLLRNKPIPLSHDIEMCLQGNLCRCTGYRPIIAAFKTFENPDSGCPAGSNCCKNKSIDSTNCQESTRGDKPDDPLNQHCFSKYDASQEILFPPELLISAKNQTNRAPLKFVGEKATWFRPTTLKQLTKLKQTYPNAYLVVGNTEIGIETWVKGRAIPYIISPAIVPELLQINVSDTGIAIGASCTLTDIRNNFIEITLEKDRHTIQPLQAFLDMLYWFAGDQIRNVGAIGGNIMTASPISDLNPIFLACESAATFVSCSDGERTVVMDHSFFPSYRKTCAKEGEVLTSVRLPFSEKNEYMKAYMQSKRREDDIAIVNAAFKVQFHAGTKTVVKFVAAFGGMAATTVMPRKTMKHMIDREWNETLLEDTMGWLCDDLPLTMDAPGGMVEYREALAASLFFKFYVYVKNCLLKDGVITEDITEEEKSTQVPSGGSTKEFVTTQTWQEVPEDQPYDDVVGRPLKHASADKQVTGEAIYLDDMPPVSGELYLALVTSTRPHAYIRGIDIEAATQSSGFVSWVDYRDVPSVNDLPSFGEVFAKEKVVCVGCVIGAVVADTQAHAQAASRLVKVTYEDISPAIITIEDAIKHESFYGTEHKLIDGDPEAAMKKCDHVIEGEFRMGGQEHFYLETQACLAIPKKEDGEMEIYASTQHPSMLQSDAANILGIAANKVTVHVKRLGGGFGGKETRFHVLTNPVVIAAHKCGKPVRCMLTRQEDMLITGGRHPFLSKYKVGFMKNGKVVSLINSLYSNAGCTFDLSGPVMDRALFSSNINYKIPNVKFIGRICRTNVPSNTAFRGFGGPQGLFVNEEWISQVAAVLDVSPEQIRDQNLYAVNDVTSFGQELESFETKKCWKECLEKSHFEERKLLVEDFNAKNRWRKRGISCVPTTYGIAFTATFLNQAGALVHIYKDGSVLLTHGGTEMGQGLHTKMMQVASRCLGIPLSFIHISETGTNTVPNTSPTAASASSDLNGAAIQNACNIILERLKPLREKNPELEWKEIVMKSYFDRISLSASGFYRTPDIHYTWDNQTGKCHGRPFNYFTCGAAVSEVEIDCLTGDHILLRTDIVMDVGKSINPAIDVGQIEGAFAQGYGLFTLEEPLYTQKGSLITRGPGTYKIPGFGDCPRQFNVHILRNSENKRALFSSKAVGEPPLFLAASVFFAIRHAIISARKESNLFGRFQMNSPATSERIRMACEDSFTKQHSRHADKEHDQKVAPWAIQA